MAGNSENLNIDITATTDKAVKDIDGLQKKVDKLEKTDAEVEVSADTKGATSDIDTFAQKLERLSARDQIITLAMKAGQAQTDLNQLRTDLALLDSEDPEIDVKVARIAEVSSELDSLESKIKAIGDANPEVKVEVQEEAHRKLESLNKEVDKLGTSNGPRLAGNQISDLTGPFGDASGAASDFGGVFDGLADISEKVAGSIGLDAEKIAGAISGIGLGVAAAAAVWTIFTQNEKKAREEQEKLTKGQEKFNAAIKAGKLDEAAQDFVDTYGKFFDTAKKAGITWDEFVHAVTTGDFSEINAKVSGLSSGMQTYAAATGEARIAWIDANGTLDEHNAALDATKAALVKLFPALQETTSATDQAKTSTDAAKASNEAYVTALQAVKEGLEADKQAQDDLVTAMRDAADANLNVDDKANAYAESLNGLNEKVKEAKKNHEDVNQVYRDNTRAAADLADAIVNQRVEQDKANGVVTSASTKQDTWNSSMLANARLASGPARQSILDYTFAANQVPTDIATEISAAVEAGDLEKANALLADASKARTATVKADADDASLAKTNADLDKVAKDRTVRLAPSSPAIPMGATSC